MGPVALILHYIANILKMPRISGKIFLAFSGLDITIGLSAILVHDHRPRHGGRYLPASLLVMGFLLRTS